MVFDADDNGRGLSDTVVDAIVSLVDGVRFGVIVARVSADPLSFVQRIVPIAVEQESNVDAPTIADLLPDGAPDGEPDGFVDVRARARLGFEVHVENRHVAPLDFEQRFRVVVRVLGDDLIIDEQTLRIVVPPGAPPAPPGVLDAGPDAEADGQDEDAG
jgi:hypothetical protein